MNPTRVPVLAALFVVALLATTVPVPAQQALRLPLTIDSITFPDGESYFGTIDDHGANGESYSVLNDVQVVVRNDGERTSSNYELLFEWVSPAGDYYPLNGDEVYSTIDGDPLEVGKTRTHRFTWEPQGSYIKRETPSNPDSISITGLGPGAVSVRLRELQSTTDEVEAFVALHDFHLGVTDQQQTIGADETIHLPIAVANYGNVDEELTWEVTDAPSRLEASFVQPTVTHAPGSSQQTLVVRYPYEGVLEDAEDLVITVAASSAHGIVRRIQTPPIDIEHDRAVPVPGIQLDAPAAAVHAPPGEAADAVFTLTNTGDSPDTYTLSVQPHGGWQATAPLVDGAPTTRVTLGPDESEAITVEVLPPAGADSASLLELTAVGDAGATSTATAFLQISGPRPQITAISLADGPVYKGDPLAVVVDYTNVGDQRLTGATLTATVTYDDGTQQSDTVALGDLEAGHDRRLPVPLGVAEGAGRVVVGAFIQAGNPATGTTPSFVRLADVRVTAPLALPGLAGEQVRYHLPPHAFQVSNHGNEVEDVSLTLDGATLLGGSDLELLPGQTRTVAVTQAIPDAVGDALHMAVTLRADLDSSPGRGGEATVLTPVQDQQEPVLAWNDVPDALTAYDSSPVRLQVTDDTLVDAAWIDVAPDPDQEGAEDLEGIESSFPLFESNGLWVARLHAGAAGTYLLTPHARDAYGNEASGPVHVLTVTAAPEPVLPDPEAELEVRNVTVAGAAVLVRTDASSLRYTVDGGAERALDVLDGEALLDLVLEPGSHLIEVTVDQDGRTTTQNTTIDVPEPVQDAPGLVGRLTPGPGIGLVLVAVAVVGWSRRR